MIKCVNNQIVRIKEVSDNEYNTSYCRIVLRITSAACNKKTVLSSQTRPPQIIKELIKNVVMRLLTLV